MTAACPEFVFDVTLQPAPALGDAGVATLGAALDVAAEARGLSVSRLTGDERLRFRITCDAGQAIDDDRDAIRAWAESRADVSEVVVGPLIDLRAHAD